LKHNIINVAVTSETAPWLNKCKNDLNIAIRHLLTSAESRQRIERTPEKFGVTPGRYWWLWGMHGRGHAAAAAGQACDASR